MLTASQIQHMVSLMWDTEAEIKMPNTGIIAAVYKNVVLLCVDYGIIGPIEYFLINNSIWFVV